MSINEIIVYLMVVFMALGAVDRILGNRFGLGEKFEEGIMAMGSLALAMIGIICLAPVLANLLRPVVVPLYQALGADPAMFAEMQAARSAGKPKKAKKSLMARAVDSLSRVEQPRRELERRLIKGLEDSETKEDVKAVLDRLEEMKLLSDQRFAEMKVRSAAPRMGDRKLQAELRRSGVDEATVRAAMEQLDEPE